MEFCQKTGKIYHGSLREQVLLKAKENQCMEGKEKFLEKIRYIWSDNRCKAFLINIVFFCFYFFVCNPNYETNDDAGMANIVAGASGNYSSYMIFINIVMGKILKTLTVALPMIKWYVVMHYVTLFLAFWVLTYILIVHCHRWGYYASIFILFYFGYECYVNVQFTKTAGAATVAGVLAIFYALDKIKERYLLLILGFILTIVGSMVRFDAYGMILLIFCVFGIRGLVNRYRNNCGDRRIRNLEVFKYIAVWIIVVGSALAIKYVDTFMYQASPEWSEYREFNEKRSELLDYGFPEYEEFENEYKELGISENSLEMFKNWNFADPEVFTIDLMDKLIALKTPKKINAEFFGNFFKELIPGFLEERVFQAVLIMVLCWICFKRPEKWSVIYSFMAILGINFYFFYVERYLQYRVDVTLWMAETVLIAYLMGNCLKKPIYSYPGIICGFVGILAIVNIDILSKNITYDDSGTEKYKEFYSELAQDTENLYLSDVPTDGTIKAYPLLTRVNKGSLKNFCLLGGWGTNMPDLKELLIHYNITNPFREAVDNKQVYLIDNADVNQKMQYIREHYNKNAQAVLVKQYDGFNIYRIVSDKLQVDVEHAEKVTKNVVDRIFVSENKHTIQIKGTVFVKGENSFKQNVYVQIINNKNGKMKYEYVLQRNNDNYDDAEHGKYGGFKCVLNKYEIGGKDYSINVILESAGKTYVLKAK